MSRQITLLDLVNKIDLKFTRDDKVIKIDDLAKVFMATRGHPVISSEGTFNEKMRTLVRLGILSKYPKNNNLVVIEWDEIDKLIAELSD